MKNLTINDRMDVDIGSWVDALRKAGVKGFYLNAKGKECGIRLYVNLEKVTVLSDGEGKLPEAVEAIANITIILH